MELEKLYEKAIEAALGIKGGKEYLFEKMDGTFSTLPENFSTKELKLTLKENGIELSNPQQQTFVVEGIKNIYMKI